MGVGNTVQTLHTRKHTGIGSPPAPRPPPTSQPIIAQGPSGFGEMVRKSANQVAKLFVRACSWPPAFSPRNGRSRSFGLIGATAEVSDTIRLIRVSRHGRWVRQPVGRYAPVPVAGVPSPCDTAPGPWDEHGALVPGVRQPVGRYAPVEAYGNVSMRFLYFPQPCLVAQAFCEGAA